MPAAVRSILAFPPRETHTGHMRYPEVSYATGPYNAVWRLPVADTPPRTRLI